MAASSYSQNFESLYGVTYLAYLRDGEGFNGKAKRAARVMTEEQYKRDEELFTAYGTGVLRLQREGDEHNRYLAGTKAYGDCEDFVIDRQDEGNLTRFINRSFTAPNVRSEHVFHNQRWHRVLRADRDIKMGEPILWNYGVDYWRTREVPAEL